MKKVVLNGVEGKGKRGQQTMGLPFGMIFSIILIIVFIVIAFIAIGHFLDLGKCAQVGEFYNSLQEEINEIWVSQESQVDFDFDLPGGVKKICFANLSEGVSVDSRDDDYKEIERFSFYKANIFLLPAGESCEMPHKFVEHIDTSETGLDKNPYCFDLNEQNSVRLKKGFYDKLVFIE